MASEKANLLVLTRSKYTDQAKYYLNGFWKSGAEAEAENIWKYAHKFIELDTSKKDGNELDEFQSHKFLESLGETLTVIQLREKLRKIDLDANGKMALLEYLIFKYSKTIKEVLECPQGDNQDEVNEAAEKLQKVQDALNEVQTQLENQTKALEAQKKALEDQRKAEESVKKAEAEQKAALEELKKQEETYSNLLATLQKKANDTGGSTVQRSKAAAELAQVKSEDPLPLRKAKISTEATIRKVEKERKASEAATVAAEGKTSELEDQTRKVEQAVKETEARFNEAADYLEEVKKKSGTAYGAIWWMERELKEAQKYMPKKKQQALNS